MARIDFRAPQRHKDMIKDIAKNRGVSYSQIMRESLEEYLSGYSTIPSLKIVAQQVERMQRKLNEIEKALLKKGILD